MPRLLQDMIMLPVHFAEGLSVRYRSFRTLYRLIAPAYWTFRPWFYFGEDLFLEAINAGDAVLELGCGTGFLTRIAGDKSR